VWFDVTLKKKPAPNGRAAELEATEADPVAARTSVGSGGIAYTEWSDLDLVASLVDESGDAYAELYRRHARSVTAAARMILVNDDRCDDVVAEVFVSLWFFPEKFDPTRGTVLAYLRLKARGRSIDLVRAEIARRRREDLERRSRVDGNDDADAVIVEAETALAVRDALAQLPMIEREPIRLAFFSGMTYKDVADKLELPEGTVKSRIRAGLNRLQMSDGLLLLRGATVVSETEKLGLA
jgi:RNA polymerase sigma-70 factor (ECF subfamily)